MEVRKWFLRKGRSLISDWCCLHGKCSNILIYIIVHSVHISCNQLKLSVFISFATVVINSYPSSNISCFFLRSQNYGVIRFPFKTCGSVSNFTISGNYFIVFEVRQKDPTLRVKVNSEHYFLILFSRKLKRKKNLFYFDSELNYSKDWW